MSQRFAGLQADHRRAFRVLELFLQELEEPAGEADVSLLASAVAAMASSIDRRHCRREDMIFERLTAHDPSLATLRLEMRRSQQQLNALGASLRNNLNPTPGVNVLSGPRLAALSRQYGRALRDHVDIEEEVLFPLAERLLDEHDWELIDRRGGCRRASAAPQRLAI